MSKRVTTEEFIRRSKLVHGNTFDYSDTIYTKFSEKLTIICNKHGPFEQIPHNHLSGSGCLKCQHDSYKLGLGKFINRAKEIHGNRYEYDESVYVNSQTKVKIKCKSHGIFEQTPNSHINQKQGCISCWRNRQKSNTEDFIEKSIKIHGDVYDYSESVYIGSLEPIKIRCIKHGEFYSTPNRHLSGNGGVNRKVEGCGCPKCGCRLNTEIFIRSAKDIHGDLYVYDMVDYNHSLEKVSIKCRDHGVFKQTPSSHIGGSGCPKCNTSKGERKIYNLLIDNNVIFETEKKFEDCRHINILPFDFYIPEHNTLIEFDGEQHFESIKSWGGEEQLKLVQQRDLIKTDWCKSNGYKLIRIPYFEFDNIENILEEVIR